MPDHSEGELAYLLDFIAGRGDWAEYSPGMWTYPEGDAEARHKHDACLELERRGKIRRKHEEPGLCIWEPVP